MKGVSAVAIGLVAGYNSKWWFRTDARALRRLQIPSLVGMAAFIRQGTVRSLVNSEIHRILKRYTWTYVFHGG